MQFFCLLTGISVSGVWRAGGICYFQINFNLTESFILEFFSEMYLHFGFAYLFNSGFAVLVSNRALLNIIQQVFNVLKDLEFSTSLLP